MGGQDVEGWLWKGGGMTERPLKKGHCALVYWLDATRRNDWEDAADTLPLAHIFSVGFVHEINDEKITLCGDLDIDDGGHGNKTSIPRGMIQSIKRLNIGKLPRKETNGKT